MPRIAWSFCLQALDPLARPQLEGDGEAKRGFLVVGGSSANPTCWAEFLSLAGDLPSSPPSLSLEQNESP